MSANSRFLRLLTATALMGSMSAPALADITLTATVRDFCTSASGYTKVNGCTTNPDFDESAIESYKEAVMKELGADGKPVYSGQYPTSNAAWSNKNLYSNEANFNQWFNDVEGVNKTMSLDMTFTETEPGIYTYSSNSFFPIDGQGWGNQGKSHNYHFTLELATTFTYQEGQTFKFSGDDDVWVFINNQLVIDLGGVHGVESGEVKLDQLGLEVGQDYTLHFFFAERRQTESNLTITTSIQLNNATPRMDVPEPSALALLGLALAGAGVTARRRKA